MRYYSTAIASLFLALLASLHAAYRGHGNDANVKALLSAYPALQGTAADSCATCHRAGEVQDPTKPGSMRRENHCGFCHLAFVSRKGDIQETLNRYGKDYLAAGRNAAAAKSIAGKDSDSDGFPNETELERGTNPGDAASNPTVRDEFLAGEKVVFFGALKNSSK